VSKNEYIDSQKNEPPPPALGTRLPATQRSALRSSTAGHGSVEINRIRCPKTNLVAAQSPCGTGLQHDRDPFANVWGLCRPWCDLVPR